MTVNLRYTLSDAGTQAWGANHYVSLRDSNGNYLAFVPLAGIAPGGNTTASFSFTAPAAAGTYTYYVQALENGVEFFSTQSLVTLTVVTPAPANGVEYNATTFPSTAAPGSTVSFSYNVTNTGTQSWGANNYLTLRDADDNFLGFLPLNGTAPGASQTLNFSFTAPSSPGIYTYSVQAMEAGVQFFEMSDTLQLNVQ